MDCSDALRLICAFCCSIYIVFLGFIGFSLYVKLSHEKLFSNLETSKDATGPSVLGMNIMKNLSWPAFFFRSEARQQDIPWPKCPNLWRWILILEHYKVIRSTPFNPGRFGGGKARHFREIFHLTTWNIPPHMCFGLPKQVGRYSGC